MSDQPKPAEIEDVLSSIRRLVSGTDDAPAPRAVEEDGPAEPEAEDDALVLTAAQRVGDEEGDAGPTEDDGDALMRDAAEDTETEGGLSEPLEDTAEPHDQSADASDAEEGDSETRGEGPQPAPAAGRVFSRERKSPFLSESLVARRAVEAGHRLTPEHAAPDAPSEAPAGGLPEEAPKVGFGFGDARREDPVRHVPLSGLASGRRAGSPDGTDTGIPPASVSDTGQHAAPDADPETAEHEEEPEARLTLLARPEDRGQDEEPVRGPIIAPDFATHHARLASTAASSHDAAPAEGEAQASADGAPDSGEAETAPAATIPADAATQGEGTDGAADDADTREEAHVGDADRGPVHAPSGPEAALDPEDDLLADEQPAQAPPATPDAAALVAPVPAPRRDLEEAAFNVFGAGMRDIDEEALRAIIVDCVHRELQGAFGDRVSSNIRRMVQREIARALEARDLD